MLQEYNYIAFDFETTGLDTKKDEPIQLGIVQFSPQGEILDTYVSLIKPKKPIKELKGIVQFLTGFSLTDLEDAPSIEQVIEEVKHFFTENTIVVGHNISFDVAMLTKYLPFNPHLEVDTYPLSRQFLHRLPSYALDVIHEWLCLNKGLQASSQENSAHDALHDSYMSYDLFMYLITKAQTLRRKYLLIDFCVQQSDGMFSTLIKRTEKPYKFEQKKLFFPPLGATSSTTKKVHSLDPLTLPDSEKSVLGLYNSSIRDLLTRIQRSSGSFVLSVTHKSKQRIIHRILDELYVTHTTFNDQIIFDEDRIDKFLHKESFDDYELGFIWKYFSHLDAGSASMDINTPHEYKIFSAITHRKEKSRTNITVCTHDQLWTHSSKISPDDTVFFLDYDRWYQSFANSLKAPFDPYRMLNLIEQIAYECEILGIQSVDLLHLRDVYTIFIGLLSGEINQYFSGFAGNRREFDGMIDDTRFPKSRQALPGVQALVQQLSGSISQDHATAIQTQFDLLLEYLNGSTTVEKRMYNGDKRRYIFHRRDIFVDYDEFIASLPPAKYIFGTTSTSKKPDDIVAVSTHSKKQPLIQLTSAPSIKQVLQKLRTFEKQNNHFIFSTSKQKSKELFDKLVAEGYHEKRTITAENITGGVGKNVFHAQQSTKPVLCIGGYSFYLELLAKKFAFSHVFLYHIFGSMKQQIVTDLIRYGT